MKDNLTRILGLALIASFLISSCRGKESNGSMITGTMSRGLEGCSVSFYIDSQPDSIVVGYEMPDRPGQNTVEATNRDGNSYVASVPATEEGKRGFEMAEGSSKYERNCALITGLEIREKGVQIIYACDREKQEWRAELSCEEIITP